MVFAFERESLMGREAPAMLCLFEPSGLAIVMPKLIELNKSLPSFEIVIGILVGVGGIGVAVGPGITPRVLVTLSGFPFLS